MLWMGGVKQAAYLPGSDGDRRGVIPVFYFCGVRLYCLCSQQCGCLAWGIWPVRLASIIAYLGR